jgi:hypothetical protein
MEIVSLLVWKILNMFIVMGIGAYLYKKEVISDRTTEELGKILIQVVLPSVVLSQMWTGYSAEKQQTLIRCFVLGMLAQILAVGAAWIRFRRDADAAARGCSAFSNVGFFGIPVITAVMGSAAVFYVSPTVGTANLLMSTLLVAWFSRSTEAIRIKSVLLNPALISLVTGIVLFFLKVPRPDIVSDVLSTVNQLNTPVALLLSGAFLARSDLPGALRKPEVWRVTLWRLVLIPAAILLLFRLIPVGSAEEKTAIWISLSCPIGMNLPVYARLYDPDSVAVCAEEVCITTLLSITTLPLGLLAVNLILK